MPGNEAEVQGERVDSRKGDSQAGGTADAVAVAVTANLSLLSQHVRGM